MAYTVNSSKRIVWVGSDPNNPYEIRRVVYCDNYGTPHDIWPCDAELYKLYIVRIRKEASWPYDIQSLQRDDEVTEYHTDSNGEPTVTLLPYWEGYKNTPAKHNIYAIKGDVKIHETVNGQRTGNYEIITDCYFFSETRETKPGTQDGSPIIGDGTTKYGPRVNSSYNWQYPDWQTSSVNYVTYKALETPGESQWINPQCGYYDKNTGYVQLGYIFDPNYSTPMWLKRATVYQALILTASAGSNDPYPYWDLIKYGESITVYPKVRLYATAKGWTNNEYERYYLADQSDITLDYDSSILSITPNNDGSYTITPVVNDDEYSAEVTFNYKNGESMEEREFTVGPDKEYQVWIGNGMASNRTIISEVTLSIRECADYNSASQDWSTVYYGNNFTITSSNTNAVSVSGKKLIPNLNSPNQTSRITVTVNGQQARPYYFDITVGEVQNTFYQIGMGTWDNITWQESHIMSDQNNIEFYTNSDVNTLAIRFATNGDMTNPRPVSLSETEYEVGNRTIYTGQPSNNIVMWTGYTYRDGYEGTLDPNVEIYDGNGDNLLGTFTVTIEE